MPFTPYNNNQTEFHFVRLLAKLDALDPIAWNNYISLKPWMQPLFTAYIGV